MQSDASLDGSVQTDGTVANGVNNMNLGFFSTGAQTLRGFLSFSPAAIRSGYLHVSVATLSARQGVSSVTDPYPALGPVQVLPVNYGTGLTAGAFTVAPEVSCGAPYACWPVLANVNTPGVYYSVDVTSFVAQQLADPAHAWCQFMLAHIFVVNPSSRATSNWATGESTAFPELAVTYDWAGPLTFP